MNTVHKTPSPFFGISLIASAGGLTMLFTESASFGFRIGTAIGQLLSCSILALPIFILWKYATRNGKAASKGKGFNAFSVILAVTWLLLFVIVKNTLPQFIAGYEAGREAVRAETTNESGDTSPKIAHANTRHTTVIDEYNTQKRLIKTPFTRATILPVRVVLDDTIIVRSRTDGIVGIGKGQEVEVTYRQAENLIIQFNNESYSVPLDSFKAYIKK